MKMVRDGYKMTELGEIPNEWNVLKLSEIAEINPRREVLDDSSVVSFIAMEDITNSGRVSNKSDRLYEEVKKGYTPFKDNDVLLAKITPCFENGKRALVEKLSNGIGFGSTEFHVLRANKKSISRFLYYVISSHRFMSKAENNMTGSAGQKRVPTEFIKDYVLAIPTIKEQEKITSILSTVDEQIDNVDALIEKNKELKKGLMQNLLTKGIGHTKFKKTEIGEIPEEWEVRILGDIVEFSQGIQVSLEEQYEEYKYGYERFLRIIDYTQKSKEYRYIKHPGERYLVKNNDVVMVRYGATAGFVGTGLEGAIANNIFKITPNREVLLKEFLYVYLNQDNIFKSLNMATGASAMPAINFGIVSKLNIILPSIYEQKKITSILFEVDKKLEEYENKKQKLEELKKGLIQQLLTGKIRVIRI